MNGYPADELADELADNYLTADKCLAVKPLSSRSN